MCDIYFINFISNLISHYIICVFIYFNIVTNYRILINHITLIILLSIELGEISHRMSGVFFVMH